MTLPPTGPWLRHDDRRDRIVGSSALVLAVLITLTTLWFSRSDQPQGQPPTAPAPTPSPSAFTADFASASDDDPVSIITDEPTCRDWEPINNALNADMGNGWLRRDPAVPASAWTDEQRRQHLAVADSMRAAADRTVNLAKATPHRVMRELYGQAIAYWRTYADSIETYRPPADHLARAAVNAAEAVNGICASIDFGSASARSPVLLPGPPPVPDVSPTNPDAPARYVDKPSPFCTEWNAMVADYAGVTRMWRETLDPNIPARYWAPEQRKLGDDTAGVMRQNADRTQLLGLLSGNLVAADFAALSAQYRRAFAMAIPTFALPDIHLDNTALRLQALTNQACYAVQS